MFTDLRRDVMYGLRMLRKNAGVTTIAALSLALGIGANTAIFTVLRPVLLSRLPVKNPQQLVLLTNPNEHGRQIGFGDGNRDLLTYPEFQYLSAQNKVFEGMLAADSYGFKSQVAINSAETGSIAQGCMVSGSYFSALGVNPILGRVFTEEVDKLRDANPIAVISYGFWKGRFGGDPSVIGKKLRILSTTYDVIGVTPPHFFGETVGASTDIWIPLTMQSEIFPGSDYLSTETNPFTKREWLQVIGRLRPGGSVAQAQASVNVLFQQYLESQTSSMSVKDRQTFLNQRIALQDGSHGTSTLRAGFGEPLVILMVVVSLVLLIACANVANLLLARGEARRREIAIRVAMGASGSRLFRQVLTESILLAGIGGVLGLALSQWADAGLLRLVSGTNTPIPLDVNPDAGILGFTFGVSVLTGILFGLAPALRASRAQIGGVLKGSARGVIGGASRNARMPIGKVLVAGQASLALLLLVVAGLFLQSFRKLTDVPLGYDRDHLMVFYLNPTIYGYKGATRNQLYKDILARISTIPGVRSVSLSENGLLKGNDSNSPITIEGFTPSNGQEMDANWDHAGPNYFATTGIPIVMGRDIAPEDGISGQRVGVINQTFARYYFGNANPLGKRVSVMSHSEHADFVIVGVAGDAKYHTVRETPARRFYVPYFNPIEEVRNANVEVRTAGEFGGLPMLIRQAVKQAGPNLPTAEVSTMRELLDSSLTTENLVAKLSGAFGGLAIVLSCIGIYGVMAYAVAGRTNEMGIRMALGAQPGSVLFMIMREALLVTLIGAAVGTAGALAATRFLSTLLFGLSPHDPVTLAGAAILLLMIAALAAAIPAWRASRTDPIVALRYE